MTIENDLARLVADRGADFASFAAAAVADGSLRDEIVRLMLADRRIMVYYHCYEIADRASRERPDLFYGYWDELVPLLGHANSYHRDIALTMLANLTAADGQDRFAAILPDYLARLDDAKFMTGLCCVRNLGRILRHKPALRDAVAEVLLGIDARCRYPEKRKELLKHDVIEALDGIYESLRDRKRVNDFVLAAAGSASPKTRARAGVFRRKHGL